MEDVIQETVGEIMHNEEAATNFVITLADLVSWPVLAIIVLFGLVSVIGLIIKKVSQ